MALYRPMLRANGAKIFALIINGKPQALQAIASITYRTRNNSSFTVKNRAPAGARLTPRVLMSRLYQTLDSDWTTDPATITLKDGRTFEIPGVLINW